MEELDGDDGVLRSPITGDKCRRDIVQFVPFNDFKRGHRQGPKVKQVFVFFNLAFSLFFMYLVETYIEIIHLAKNVY